MKIYSDHNIIESKCRDETPHKICFLLRPFTWKVMHDNSRHMTILIDNPDIW